MITKMPQGWWKSLYSPQTLMVKGGGHILTTLDGDKDGRMDDTIRCMFLVDMEERDIMGNDDPGESEDPRRRNNILPSVVKKQPLSLLMVSKQTKKELCSSYRA